MIQYITNSNSPISVTDQIRQVIDGGCRWIQIRLKDASDEEIKSVVNEVKPVCKESETILILNDRVELAKELEVDGVHLGKEDMLPTKAREILGAGPIIGATVNSFDDINSIKYFDIDYVGMGPFRFTETKKNLAPVIGLEGYKAAMQLMHENNIELPVVAIGGITLDDVTQLWETGVNGIAVSGAIANANDIAQTTREFIKLFNKPNKIG